MVDSYNIILVIALLTLKLHYHSASHTALLGNSIIHLRYYINNNVSCLNDYIRRQIRHQV